MTSVADEARKGLAYALHCTQCGGRFSDPACGPTHAILTASPELHPLVAPLIEEATRATADLETAARAALSAWGEWAASVAYDHHDPRRVALRRAMKGLAAALPEAVPA